MREHTHTSVQAPQPQAHKGKETRPRVRRLAAAMLGAGVVAASGLTALAPLRVAAVTYQDWPTYLHDAGRTAGSGEAILSPANANALKLKWAYATANSIVASPAVVNDIVYEGSWDGYEYAINGATGALQWKTSLGQTNDANCFPHTLGITSGAAVVNGVVYVGGGDSNWYALNASTGAVLWSVPTGDNSATGAHYNWSSPLIAGNAAYIGIASNCDNPLVQGQLLRVDLTSHQVVASVNFVDNGQVGGGIWTSPALDAATNTVYVSSGTLNQYTQTLSQAVVALDGTTLAIKDHWQLPFADAVLDSDFGTTPTLTSDAQGRPLLSVANKNGAVYTFRRCPVGPTCTTLSAGAIWQDQIAIGGDCPTCGDGTISSGAFAPRLTVNSSSGAVTGPVLFFGAGNVVINGAGHRGSVSAIDPGTGRVYWTHPTDQGVFGSLAYDNGLVIYGQGPTVEVLNAATGQDLYDYTLGAPIYGAPAISHGEIFIGGTDSKLYAFGLPGSSTTPPPDPNCPAGFTCQDIRSPGVSGSETANADGSVTVTASGAAIHGTSDQFRFISTQGTGDGQLSAKITQQSFQNTQPQAGVMYRQSADPTSPYYAVLEYPNDSFEGLPQPMIEVWFRSRFGGTAIELDKLYPAVLPQYLLIQRQGDVFTASSSSDGVHYTLIPGTRQAVVMPASVMQGFAIDSGATNNSGTATFTQLTLGPLSTTPAPQPSAHACPAGFQCRDVGLPAPIGDQTLANGAWTVYGAGTGVGGYQDSFHFAGKAMSGDGTISARLNSFANNAAATTQGGIMMRAGLDPSASYYAILFKPNAGATVQWRVNNGITTRTKIALASLTLPAYVELSRYTDTAVSPSVTYYSTLTSADGVTWSPVAGSTVVLDFGGGQSGTTFAGMVATSGVNHATVATAFQNLTYATTSTRPPGVCPADWTCEDIGSGQAGGNQTVTNSGLTWTVLGAGGDIWSVYDQFRYVHQALAGDGTVSARIVSTTNYAGPWQKSGVMIRSGTDPQAPYFGVFVTPSHGVAVQYRSAQAGSTQQVLAGGATPVYVMAARYTDPSTGAVYFAAYTSADGVHFSWVPGSTVQLALTGSLTAGMAMDSQDPSTVATTVFDSVAILNSAPAPPGTCPSGWSCADIGGALPAGSQVNSGGTWTFQSGGGDMWGTADSFHFAWQQLSGDGTVAARVVSIGSTAGVWAKEGVMLRASTDPGSAYYGALVTPGNPACGGTPCIAVQYRTAQGGGTSQVASGGALPAYIQIARWTDATSGVTYFTTYGSPDGSTWTPLAGTTVAFSMPQPLLAGMATDSYNQGTPASVTMDTVSISAQEFCSAPGWNCEDINGATPAGSQSDSAGTWSILGGGGDIWGTSDQFRYVWQTPASLSAISARLSAQSASDPWAKAGLMLRVSSDPAAPYYAVFMTPGHGVAVQWRGTQGGTSAQVLGTGTLPLYLQIIANGTTFSASTSTDGVNWTTVAGSTQTLAGLGGALLAGIAVTSHNTGALSSTTFDNVTLR